MEQPSREKMFSRLAKILIKMGGKILEWLGFARCG
jgi:hypothetical protein